MKLPNEPTRYVTDVEGNLEPHRGGGLILWSDYHALRSLCEQLKEEIGAMKAIVDAACNFVHKTSYTRNMGDDDPNKGVGNYLSDAVDTFDAARKESDDKA